MQATASALAIVLKTNHSRGCVPYAWKIGQVRADSVTAAFKLLTEAIPVEFRNTREEDYLPIIRVIDDWWDGRHMADMLPRLFFVHFQDTSFVATDSDRIVGFLVGFVSQTHPMQAYIHFVGVHPDYRKQDLGKALYEKFFATVQERGCSEIHAVTSPVNKASIEFHVRMGFEIEEGDAAVDGVQVKRDYDGRGQSRVRFMRRV